MREITLMLSAMPKTLYLAYHRPAPLISSEALRPIHVGRALAAMPLPGMIGDDTGDHVSGQNPALCELSALYWAWKNDHASSWIGLMHYRRLLDLTDWMPGGPAERRVQMLEVAPWCARIEGWLAGQDGPSGAAALEACDLVVPRLHVMGQSVAQNYRHAHQPQDWEIAREVIAHDHSGWLGAFDAVAAAPRVRLGNMMLMRRPLFEAYCSWLFDILFKVAARDVPRAHYSPAQARYLGFLAERLLTVYVHGLMTEANPPRLREVSILNLSRAVICPWLAPETHPEALSDQPPEQTIERGPRPAAPARLPRTVSVAFAADRAYLPHTAAMLRSLMDHADPSRPLALYFLHDDIAPQDLALLDEMIATRPRTRLIPIDTAGVFDASYRSASRSPSNATYNRFLLFSLLPGLPRLVYLDGDVILRHDVCALHDAEIGAAPLAGVPDWIMTRTLTGPVPTADPEVPELGAYQRDRLGLGPEDQAGYVNAGVLLFQFAALSDPQALGRQLIAEARTGRYLFRDQDILNRTFRSEIAPLDARWNVFNSPQAAYGRVPQSLHARAMAARRDPWAIHYADRDNKPWTGRAVPMAEAYWQALIRTPFYAEVLAGLSAASPAGGALGRRLVAAGRSLGDRVPPLKRPLLRIYGGLRRLRG